MARLTETDLFGEPLWDEKAFPRKWVEQMSEAIEARAVQKFVGEELEYRRTHNVMDEATRPLSWEQAVILQGGPLAEILLGYRRAKGSLASRVDGT